MRAPEMGALKTPGGVLRADFAGVGGAGGEGKQVGWPGSHCEGEGWTGSALEEGWASLGAFGNEFPE